MTSDRSTQQTRSGHVDPPLDGVALTALITLYNRASEARRPDRLLDDPLAVSLLDTIDYPFRERFGRPDLAHVLRAILFDQQVTSFLRTHPQGTVISLGEGLETQLWRVDNGAMRWITVDLPEIIELRRRLLPSHPRDLLVTGSALDPAWTQEITEVQKSLIVCQGLLMYFTRSEVDAFLTLVCGHCPGATVLFDTIPAWAATDTGHRQSAAYRMPPQPWGTGRRGVQRMAGQHAAITDLQFHPAPRGRGLAWGVLYPAATRIPGLRGLLPTTITLNTSQARERHEWHQQ